MSAKTRIITSQPTADAGLLESPRSEPGDSIGPVLNRQFPAALQGALRIFCEAVLAISASDRPSQGQSLLLEVLPSLPATFSRCGFRAAILRDELATWADGAKRLMRHATWHCSQHGQQLIERFERIEFQASQIVDAVAAMQQLKTATAGAATDSDLSLSSDSSPPADQVELVQLLHFCRAVVELTLPGPPTDGVVTQVFPTVHLLFQRCTPNLLARLRSELASSEAHVEELLDLAAAHCEPAAAELQRGMQRSHSLAASVLDSLEALYFFSLEASDTESNRSSHTVQLARDTFPPGQPEKGPSTNSSSRADICYRMGARCHRQELLVAAENFYSQAIAADDHHYLAHRQRGAIRLKTGRSNEALADLAQALMLQDDDAQSRRWRADALAAMGRFREAVMDYSHLLEQSPNAVDVRLSRAVALRELGEQDQAARELEKILRSGARSARLHVERGLIWEARGERKHAAAEYRAALTLTPDDPLATQSLQRLTSEQVLPSSKSPTGQAGTTRLPAIKNHAGSPEDEILELLEGAKQSLPNKSVQRQEPAAEVVPAVPQAATILPLQGVGGDRSREQALLTVDSPGKVPSKAVPPMEAAPAAPPSQELIDNAKSGQIAIDCPSCGRQSSMHWKYLEKGKVFGCPRCQEKLVVREGGRLVKVVQDAAGSWKIDAPPPLWKNRRVIAGAAAASTLMFGLFFVVAIFGWQYASAQVHVQVPTDLESRSIVFGEAWLAKDIQIVRLLTLPAQQGNLFAWLRKNTTPKNTRGAKVQAVIVQQGPQVAQVELTLSAPNSAKVDSQQVVMDWHKERSGWLFAPSGGNPSAAPALSPTKPRGRSLPKHRPRSGPP